MFPLLNAVVESCELESMKASTSRLNLFPA
jgi:hypothetical protein